MFFTTLLVDWPHHRYLPSPYTANFQALSVNAFRWRIWSAICFKITTRYTCGFFLHILAIIPMVGHLFQNYETIYVRFFPTYTCNHSCYTIYVRFFVTYTCVLFPSIWPFSYKRAYICAQKSPYICVTNKHVVYGVTESRRIRGTELYRQQKTPSCTMELKSNFSLNQAWPQWPR